MSSCWVRGLQPRCDGTKHGDTCVGQCSAGYTGALLTPKSQEKSLFPTYFIIFLCKLIQKIKRGKENTYFASMRIESLDYGRLWYVCHKFVQYIYANPKAMCMCFFGGVCTFNWCHLRTSCGRRTERDRESWIVNHTLDMFMHLRWINFDL